MRILFVTATYLPTVNGVSYHLKTLKKELERLGHEVYILAPSYPNYKDTEKNIIRYPSLPNPFVKKYPVGVPLVSLKKIKKINPDVIHTHHPLIIGRLAAYLAEKLKRPLFFSAHTQYEQYLNYYFPHGFQITSKLIVNDLKNLAKKCRTVICPSPETEARLARYKILNTKVIFNGIDVRQFSPSKTVNTEKLSLVYTGRIEKEKNPAFLIKTAKELKKIKPDFEMNIIGDGNFLPRMSQWLIKDKLEDNVRLIGELPRDILPTIYQTGSLFFTPSTSEVMPLTIIEALACGLPIIALEKSNLNSLVVNNKNGLLLKSQPKAVAQAIVGLFADKKLLLAFSREARKKALFFSLEYCTRNLVNLYESC